MYNRPHCRPDFMTPGAVLDFHHKTGAQVDECHRRACGRLEENADQTHVLFVVDYPVLLCLSLTITTCHYTPSTPVTVIVRCC